MTAKPESYMPRRRTRRKIVYSTLFTCAQVVGYVLLWGDPANTLHTSALSWAFTLAGMTIGGYIFGATFDNANVLEAQARRG